MPRSLQQSVVGLIGPDATQVRESLQGSAGIGNIPSVVLAARHDGMSPIKIPWSGSNLRCSSTEHAMVRSKLHSHVTTPMLLHNKHTQSRAKDLLNFRPRGFPKGLQHGSRLSRTSKYSGTSSCTNFSSRGVSQVWPADGVSRQTMLLPCSTTTSTSGLKCCIVHEDFLQLQASPMGMRVRINSGLSLCAQVTCMS